ncbi:MAG: adenosine kinase [Paludibacter sp.]|nr:adenosine kinase [Paludibacter sp.]
MKKILGMGNALTDILLQIDSDAVLSALNLPKGSMQLVDGGKSKEITNLLAQIKPKMATGGSASNTINGITKLGGKGGFFGKVGKDNVGDFFKTDMLHNGVDPILELSETPSGQCTVLVSNDGERTMCTYLGAACELDVDDLTPKMFEGYDIFHIEGYLVQSHDLIRQAVKLAKEAGLLVSIDLASYNVVEENLDFLNEIISLYVDIVFANEEEARALTGKEPKEALIEIAEHCRIAVVKIGKDGSYVKSGDNQFLIQPHPANCVDTTGAGDLYAAGFLYGLAMGYSLDICGKIGSLVSGNVVEVLGAKMADEVWAMIHAEIRSMISL